MVLTKVSVDEDARLGARNVFRRPACVTLEYCTRKLFTKSKV